MGSTPANQNLFLLPIPFPPSLPVSILHISRPHYLLAVLFILCGIAWTLEYVIRFSPIIILIRIAMHLLLNRPMNGKEQRNCWLKFWIWTPRLPGLTMPWVMQCMAVACLTLWCYTCSSCDGGESRRSWWSGFPDQHAAKLGEFRIWQPHSMASYLALLR